MDRPPSGQYRPRRDAERGAVLGSPRNRQIPWGKEVGCRIHRNRAPVTQHASHHRTQLTFFLTRRAAHFLRAESFDAFASASPTSADAAPGARDRRDPATPERTPWGAGGPEPPALDPCPHPPVAALEPPAGLVPTGRR